MPRIARVAVVGLPHHVTQRGNNKERVFFSDADRLFYLKLLARYCREYWMKVLAWCLMRNHVHLLVEPERYFSLARGIGRANLMYTQHLNRARGRSGRLWQNRFFSCPVEKESYLWAVAAYIERNPVRAGKVRKAWDFRWSSARHHVLGEPDLLVSEPDWLEQEERDDYRKLLTREQDEQTEQIRRATSAGRPLGRERFVEWLEVKTGRTLQPKKAGRPRKDTQQD